MTSKDEKHNPENPMNIHMLDAFHNEPPPLNFLWHGFLAGTVGALVAPGGTGKSFWALQAAMSVACNVPGGDLLRLAPKNTGRVLYLAGEDPKDALICRIHAIGKHFSSAVKESIAKNMTVRSVVGGKFDVMDDSQFNSILDENKQVRLIVVDTLSRIHKLDENSNSEMSDLVSRLEHIAAETGAAVLYLHHVSTGSARNGHTYLQQAARGASSLIDNARWCGFMMKMNPKELSELTENQEIFKPIGNKRCEFFIRFGVSKQNYGNKKYDQWYEQKEGGVLVATDLFSADTVKAESPSRNRRSRREIA